jgi:type III pantothenate kinase
MSTRVPPSCLITVDVGNARIKIGVFRPYFGQAMPEPEQTLQLCGNDPSWDDVGPWLDDALAKAGQQADAGGVAWWIGSVNRSTSTRLIDWLHTHRPRDRVTLLAAGDLPLAVAVPRPDMVGVDRLLDAVAANELRRPGRPAVVIDVGTAITVDLVSAEGEFLGGAILPGIAMSARAMHEFTDLLPLIEMSELTTPPPALGTCTNSAMRAGLFWGVVGAIRELIGQLTGQDDPEVFLTGGAGPVVAELLGGSARHVPHLTLAGIALVARSAAGSTGC